MRQLSSWAWQLQLQLLSALSSEASSAPLGRFLLQIALTATAAAAFDDECSTSFASDLADLAACRRVTGLLLVLSHRAAVER
jgi:hypothetical protein